MKKFNTSYEYSMLEQEILKINNRELKFYIIDFYDGLKEEVSLEKNILLLWHNYKKDYEKWFQIEPSNIIYLEKYLSNEIGILSLMKNSNISLAKRYYEKYDTLQEQIKINFYDKSVKYPDDDICIGKNLLRYMYKNDITYERKLKINSEVSKFLITANIKIPKQSQLNSNIYRIAA